VKAAADSVLHSVFLAEDAAQDAFVTAWLRLNILGEPSKFGPWVCRIARNSATDMLRRFRPWISLEEQEEYGSGALRDLSEDGPEARFLAREEQRELRERIEGLPARVREIIRLHYFEGLSVAEIADRMRIQPGTVKRQLHNGRKRIRKELCAMDEEMNDTLLERVMKKVEELKNWQPRYSKSGFGEAYREVLAETEELPESERKYGALADVLLMGWWWIPGQENDALLARIADAAERGHNDRVMRFLVEKDCFRVSGEERIALIRDKQLPRLKAEGYVLAYGSQLTRLAATCFYLNRPEEGFAALEEAVSVLPQTDVYRAAAVADVDMRGRRRAEGKKDGDHFNLGAAAGIELRIRNGSPVYWTDDEWYEGSLFSVDHAGSRFLRGASFCDGRFFVPGLVPGAQAEGSGGTVLRRLPDETVETPAGRFEDCEVWENRSGSKVGETDVPVCRTFYKTGVGIVRQDRRRGPFRETRLLVSYRVAGGDGLLPLAAGNEWTYTGGWKSEVLTHTLRLGVLFCDGGTAILRLNADYERHGYDADDWNEQMLAVKNEYYREDDGRGHLCDVEPHLVRAEELASTAMERVHTKAAASVMRRIFATDAETAPDRRQNGLWNFFQRKTVNREDGRVTFGEERYYDFEWKCGDYDEPLLYNFFCDMLEDAVECVWDEKWVPGFRENHRYRYFGDTWIDSRLCCEDAGDVAVKAGTFAGCRRLIVDAKGFTLGHDYKNGRYEFTFSPGVGVIRGTFFYDSGARRVDYDLVSYTGTGEGWFPFGDGFERRYEAQGLTDGFEAGVTYTAAADEDGRIVLFADQLGVQDRLPPLTRFPQTVMEDEEDALWDRGEFDASRVRNGVNNLNAFLHLLGRPTRGWGDPRRQTAHNRQKIRLVEALGEDGQVPPAWMGWLAGRYFNLACCLFGTDTPETTAEGREYLEKAFALFPEWRAIPKGTLLELGGAFFSGIRLVKGEGMIELPDGTREPVYDDSFFGQDGSVMFSGMTASHGWEWFNPVRGEEWFAEAVERAKKMLEE
jgi:RNA polymerase sigma-70 factor (ECF subfamily)